MKTVQELRERCNNIREEQIEEVRKTIEYWIEEVVIPKNVPWRAVIGNRRCKPVPIHKDFSVRKKNINGIILKNGEICWPNFEDEIIREYIECLGFVIGKRSDYLAISVPPHEKGKTLTFAQECVRKVNDNYSCYCQREKSKAKELFSEVIEEIYNTSIYEIQENDDCVIFKDFKFSKKVSKECARFSNRLLRKNGIKPYYEEVNGKRKYIGLAVMKEF